MKTAGYDIAILIHKGFLNQVSGALYYSGFLTTHGSVDFYNGKITVRKTSNDFFEKVSTTIREKVPEEMAGYLKFGFRLKPNYEPSIDLIGDNRIRIGTGLRVYLFLWEALEIKFDAFLSVACDISINNGIVAADFANCDIEEFTMKYNGGMNQELQFSLDKILKEAIRLYFTGRSVSFELQLPSLEQHIPGIEPDENKPEDKFNIFVKAIKAVSPTSMVVAANVYEDHDFGDSTRLYEFVRNCNVGVAIAETAMHKVFNYYWERLKSKSFGKKGSFTIKEFNEFLSKVGDNIRLHEELASILLPTDLLELLTGGIIEKQISIKGMVFDYELCVHIKNKPKFDLIGGNELKVYNMAVYFSLEITPSLIVEYKVVADTSPLIPDILTWWEDDIVLSKNTKRHRLFTDNITLENVELKEGLGKVWFDEKDKVYKGKIEEVDLYLDPKDFGGPFGLLLRSIPEGLRNKIINYFVNLITPNIKPFVLSPRIKIDVPIVPWNLNLTLKKIDITNSEAIAGIDAFYHELKTDIYPVPKYIANINNTEVHRIGCDSVMDTYEVHQRGYHLLNDAVNAGFDGCKKCLPAYHTR